MTLHIVKKNNYFAFIFSIDSMRTTIYMFFFSKKKCLRNIIDKNENSCTECLYMCTYMQAAGNRYNTYNN